MLSYLKEKADQSKQQRQLKKYEKRVAAINVLESHYERLSDQELHAQTAHFRTRLQNGEDVFDLLEDAFAVVREASKRVLGMRHFDVQLIGGIVLAEGNISEMATGEGKTLVASLPSYLRALEGKGVHIITVNDYLARRDRELIGKIHEFLGLTVGLNLPMMDPAQKQLAYQADITYGIGNEFGFDYLRDNMVFHKRQKVQRPYHYAIIDEVDSVLIDEAKTPLIIADKSDVSTDLSGLCARIAKTFKQDVDFLYDEETKAASLTDDGINKIEKGFNIDNLYNIEHQTLYHYMIQAVRALVMFHRDVDYIVKDGKVLLIDMFTGRPMEGRSLSNGLHQAIEAKEGLQVTQENKTQAAVTIQNYFRQYPLLAGMTGTAKTEEKEFEELYNMLVVQIPSNRPVVRKDAADVIYATLDKKYRAVAAEAKRVHETGQPILIGTTSILQSERVAESLREAGVSYELLNAKSIEQEVRLISLAGQKGTVTVATNMAGRGTDIVLGEGVKELGGLYVLGTEKHESRRIDNQLKGRSGRQGDPGTSRFFISIEDDMFRRFARDELEKLQKSLRPDANGVVTSKKTQEFVDRTQRICEGSSFSMREFHLKLDNVLNEQRSTVYALRNKFLEQDNLLKAALPFVLSSVETSIALYCPEDLTVEGWELEKLQLVLESFLDSSVHSELKLTTDNVQSVADVKRIVEPLVAQTIAGYTLFEEKQESRDLLRHMLVTFLDLHWLEHVDAMEKLKEGIGLRGYAEDPMRQYAREGLELFQYMYEKVERDISHELQGLKRSITNV